MRQQVDAVNGEAVMEPAKVGNALAITIAGNGMGAFASLGAGAPVPSADALREALESAGVKHGVIDGALERLASGESFHA